MVQNLRDRIEQLLIVHVWIVQAHRQRDGLVHGIKHTFTASSMLLHTLKLHIFHAEVVQSFLERV
jgi:hypothetical protein